MYWYFLLIVFSEQWYKIIIRIIILNMWRKQITFLAVNSKPTLDNHISLKDITSFPRHQIIVKVLLIICWKLDFNLIHLEKSLKYKVFYLRPKKVSILVSEWKPHAKFDFNFCKSLGGRYIKSQQILESLCRHNQYIWQIPIPISVLANWISASEN